jgi:anaerobic magnesium-protoporphyrin IX monomethyl ester cyclase
MKIFLINKNCNREPLGTMIISSLLKKRDFKIFLLEADYRVIRERLKNTERAVLAYSMPTVFYNEFLDLNRRLKSQFPGILSLFGGPHPTFFPEMIEDEGVDGVCIGEGEYAMLELAQNLSEGKPITGIQNFWIKQDGKIYKNPLRPLIEDLDSLPFPDRSYSNNAISFKLGRASVMTSRGCPYKCSYCFSHAYNRLYNNHSGRVRRRSVDNVIEEIKEIKKTYPLSMILFQDDNFILDRQWLSEFLKEYKKQIKLPFWCFTHPQHIDAEVAGLLKSADCIMVGMGIECGDERILKDILKRNTTYKDIINAAKTIRQAGIYLRTNNLLGLPDTSFNTDLKTLKLNIICKPTLARASILSAYPKTDIYELAKKLKLIETNFQSVFSGANWTLMRKFRNKREKRRLENLSCLFSIIVRFPLLFFISRVLIELPLKRIFSFINLFLETAISYTKLPSLHKIKNDNKFHLFCIYIKNIYSLNRAKSTNMYVTDK